MEGTGDKVSRTYTGSAGAVKRRFATLPSLGFPLYVLHILTAWLHPGVPLSDPGVGWHLATGRYVLEHRVVPAHDLFSWTAAGRREVNFYWLFDAASAGLVRIGGLPLFVAVCILVYAAIPYLLYRRMLRMGTGLVLALGWTFVAYVVLLSHALARPHIATYIFFLMLLDRLDRFDAGTYTARGLWWLPLLMLVWCNMHGGFLVGLLVTGLFAVVAVGRAVVSRTPAEIRRAVTLAALLAGMLAATLANPNGLDLLRSSVAYFSARSPAYFAEFQSPNFLGGDAGVRAFELLVQGLLVLLALGRTRLRATEWVVLAVLLHMALASVRQMNLFALAAAPILARETAPWLERFLPALQARSRRLGEIELARRPDRVWIPVLAAAVLIITTVGRAPFPRTLEGQNLTPGAAAFIAAHTDRFERMFNTDSLGGVLIWRFWPALRVFVDDRVLVYGDHFIMDDYLVVLSARSGWRAVLDRWRVTSAVVKADAPCAALLREAPEWTVAYEDEKNLIFFWRPAETTRWKEHAARNTDER
jgi:hypothetical protein